MYKTRTYRYRLHAVHTCTNNTKNTCTCIKCVYASVHVYTYVCIHTICRHTYNMYAYIRYTLHLHVCLLPTRRHVYECVYILYRCIYLYTHRAHMYICAHLHTYICIYTCRNSRVYTCPMSQAREEVVGSARSRQTQTRSDSRWCKMWAYTIINTMLKYN